MIELHIQDHTSYTLHLNPSFIISLQSYTDQNHKQYTKICYSLGSTYKEVLSIHTLQEIKYQIERTK